MKKAIFLTIFSICVLFTGCFTLTQGQFPYAEPGDIEVAENAVSHKECWQIEWSNVLTKSFGKAASAQSTETFTNVKITTGESLFDPCITITGTPEGAAD